jgi:hypothetical protein
MQAKAVAMLWTIRYLPKLILMNIRECRPDVYRAFGFKGSTMRIYVKNVSFGIADYFRSIVLTENKKAANNG